MQTAVFPSFFVFVLATGLLLPVSAVAQQSPGTLPVQTGDYPRAFFFRNSEGFAANPRTSYERWEECFSRLMGIEGKVLDEEVPGRSARNVDFFTRFKRRHPDQLVLLHYNGNARDPRFQTEKFFAGHWVYYNGATILDDVPAEPDETTIRVSDPTLFHTEMGRYRWSSEDLGLCVLDDEGRPDWTRSEQVQLLAVDTKARTIRVRRGCYGTEPRAFPAGKAYAAAHVTEGPWGQKSNLLWHYNYATCCPRDAGGRTCGEVHAEELAARFAPDGELAAFDGLEFDVLDDRAHGVGRGRSPDCDADGVADGGVFDGVNRYGIGVVEFCRMLREKMGQRRIIQADGMGAGSQRAFHILNGIESEGWPHLSDWEIRDWSGGLNRHFFWQQNARPPVFNYVNHKFITRGEKPGEPVQPEVPFAVHRLVMAAAVCTDSAICYSFAPPKVAGELIGIWDELDKGTENQVGWLGQPRGPAVRLAGREPELLGGGKGASTAELLKRLEGDGVALDEHDGAVRVRSSGPQAGELRFTLRGVPCDGPDLFAAVTARAAPRHGYPPEVARLAWVGVAPPPGRLPAAEPARYMTFLGQEDFCSGFYFSEVRSKEVDLQFEVEGSEPVWISSVTAHAHPDAMIREFEHGLVLANPAPRPYTFNLAELLPGRKYRRLNGSPEQDPKTNDGTPVGDRVTLGPKEGLFLVRQ